jgi:hypothetical protein
MAKSRSTPPEEQSKQKKVRKEIMSVFWGVECCKFTGKIIQPIIDNAVKIVIYL